MAPWLFWKAVSSTARYVCCSTRIYLKSRTDTASRRLSTAIQILIFLPLTLSTLSTDAFLLLSLLLFIHSLIHGTLTLLWGSPALSVLQVPVHSFLLLVCFNAFASNAHPLLVSAASWWGWALRWSSPGYIVMEGVSSLLAVQKLGQIGKELVEEGEKYQFGLLVGAAAAYVTSAWWIVVVRIFGTIATGLLISLAVELVLPGGGGLSSTIHTPGSGNNDFHFSHMHWFRYETYQCH